MLFLELQWEKASNHRYYHVSIIQDLLGDLVLAKTWGTQGTRLGGHRRQVCTAYEDALQHVLTIHQRRQKHDYQLVYSDGTALL